MTQLKIVVVGHVDHGKSTFIGRLLHDTGSLPEGKLAQLEEAASRRGVPFEWANLMDGLQAERDQNITIDTAQIWFRTARRDYVLIDAPGHKEFLKNMVTGAASASAALLIIDAHEGIRDESRRHGYLLSLLGIRQVAVLVNKMDLVGYREDRFRQLEAEYGAWLGSIGVAARLFLPMAARHGDNIAASGTNLPWYSGPTVLEALDSFDGEASLQDRPLRFPVQDVYRFDERRIVAGRVESGTLRVGDRIVFSPSGKSSTVRTIERWSAPSCDHAVAGESVGITLTDALFVERGALGSAHGAPPHESTRFDCRLLWLGKDPLVTGKRYKLKLATAEVECSVESIQGVIDASTLRPARHGATDHGVERHEVAELTLRTRKPIAFDAFDAIVPTGRFVIVDGFDIAGGGIVRAVTAPRLPREEPSARTGCLLWLTGPPRSGRRRIAAELERELNTRGRSVTVLDGESIGEGLCSDLSLSERDRDEQIRRVGEVAKLFGDAGVICIATLPAPRRRERDRMRRLLPKGRFLEVHLRAAAEPSAAYEPPTTPELEIRTDRLTVSEAVLAILTHPMLNTSAYPDGTCASCARTLGAPSRPVVAPRMR